MAAGGPRRATGETDPPCHEVPIPVKRLTSLLLAALLTALAALPAAAAPPPCPASWQWATAQQAAAAFFPHLLPGQFASVADFEAVLIDDVGDNDGLCMKMMWGFELNPKSHWYQLGVNSPLGEPVHMMIVIDDR
jgi:hypothetical protein